MNYREYIIQPDGYGLVHLNPLLVANIVNTKLEQWFENNKFIHYAIDRVQPDDYAKFSLPLEYTYSMRLQENRNYDNLKKEVMSSINAKEYQILINIIFETLAMVYECKLIIETKKQGKSIKDFEKHICGKMRDFEGKSFPEKIILLASLAKANEMLEILKKMNAIRNCMEHRNGIVGKSDCKNRSYIEIKWEYPKLEDSGREVRVVGGANTGARPQIAFAKEFFTKETKRFFLGDKIEMDFHDNYKCLYTINLALKPMIDEIYKMVGVSHDRQDLIIKEFKKELSK